ncbi:MAG: CarD family transcriptional regulator [Lachnospiraceae bacterium]|nr:CarD family transcriptional regulator [Lachnospiraceae bacterium]
MFEVGDYIIYGSNGVCKVESVGPIKMPGVTKERLFYTLAMIYSNSSKVFTPVDSDKVIMRTIISPDEAHALLKDIPTIGTLQMEDERKSEGVYKDAMRTCECEEWLKAIKTLYIRKKTRLADGKKMNVSDEKYLRIAGDSLFGELAISLGKDKKEVEDYVMEQLEKATE